MTCDPQLELQMMAELPPTVHILSYGGGVDSTALVAMDLNRDGAARFLGICRADLDAAFPRPKHYLFSDTGAESRATYRTLDYVRGLAGDRLIVVRKPGESITEWCLRLGTVPVMPGGSHICSMKFKGQVLQDWAKQQGYFAPTWLIGIEAGEEGRAQRFTAPDGDRNQYHYPLIELGMDRDRCLAMLDYLGWPPVEKSSCVFCPFRPESELREMYENDREAWDICRLVEDNFQATSGEKHQRWLEAGQPLNRAGRAPRGMWRKDSYAAGARLFTKRIGGRQLTLSEWEKHFRSETIAAQA